MIEVLMGLTLFLAHFTFPFFNFSSLNFYDYCYFSAAIVLGFLFLFKLFKERPSFKVERFELGVFLVTMVVGLLLVNVRSIWIDEYSQYLATSRLDSYHSLSNGAGIEQQPPLGYLITWLSTHLFGTTIIGLRFFSLLSMSLSLIYFSRILKKFNVNRWITTIALVYLMTRVNIFEFFVEGRPYALAIFLSLLVLDYYIDLYYERRTLSCIKLATFLFFLVNSIGMQTQIFAAALFISYALLGGRQAWRKVLGCNILAAILFFPAFLNIVNLSREVSQFKEAMTWQIFLSSLSAKSQVFLNGLTHHVPFAWEIWGLWAIFVVAVTLKIKRAGFILAVTLTFATLYILLYVYFINWTLYLKYYILMVPLLVLMAAIALQSISERVYVVRTRFNKLVLSLISVAYAMIVLTGFARQVELLIDNRVMPWKSVYGYLEERVQKEDTVFFLTFNEAGEWSLVKPVGADFYLDRNKFNLVGEKYIPGSYATLPNFTKSDHRDGRVYLISPYYWSNDHLDDDVMTNLMPSLKVRYVDGVRIYSIDQNGQTDNQRLIEFLQTALNHYRDYPWTFSLRMSLIRLYALEGNKEAHERELKALLSMRQPTRRNLTGMGTDRKEIVSEVSPFLKKLP